MVVSFDGTTYTEAKPSASFVRESTTVAVIRLILLLNRLSLMITTCARAAMLHAYNKTRIETNFFIIY